MSIVLDRNPVTATSNLPPFQDIRIRRMTPADSDALDDTFAGLSERSRFLRYHAATPRLTARMRRALLDIDGARHLAHVAELAGRDGPVRSESPDCSTSGPAGRRSLSRWWTHGTDGASGPCC